MKMALWLAASASLGVLVGITCARWIPEPGLIALVSALLVLSAYAEEG